MTALDHPRSRTRPFWGDARFLLGVLLIAASVAGVWLVVGAARQTVPVLAAADTLVPGQLVEEGDLRVVDVALGAADGAYLSPGGLAAGTVVTRTVGAGELLPADAVGSPDAARVTTVVVATASDVPAAVAEGAGVELWYAPPAEEPEAFDAPRILVADATVSSVLVEEGVVGASGTSLELVIPRDEVAAVLSAVADGSALSVVPVAGPAR